MRARYQESEDAGGLNGTESGIDVMDELVRRARESTSLSEGDQMRLLQHAAAGDKQSQERLVAANLGLVIRLAEARDAQGLSIPDLVQEGSIGLVEAIRTFTEGEHGEFAALAQQLIAAQMDSALASEAAAVREGELLVAAATDYDRTDVLMRRELHRQPTEAELAEKLEWTVERTRYVAAVVAEARRQHDEQMLEFIDPEALVIENEEQGELDP